MRRSFMAAACVALLSLTAEAAPVQTYIVAVKTSFGTKFMDCFVFKPSSLRAGTLTTASGLSLIYTTHGGRVLGNMSSVSPVASAKAYGFAIEFNGQVTRDAFIGQGSDDSGDHYLLSGTVAAACGTGGGGLPTEWRGH